MSGPAVPAPEGLVVIDKPSGMTSHDVVARMRHLLHTRRVGHAGTLDPMATGVLLVGVGRATKLLTYLSGADKTYLATIRLGAATVTDDAESGATALAAPGTVRALTPGAVEAALAGLRGRIAQVPSSVSAIKVDGRRAYARVRGGEDVELAPRPVTVSRLDVLARRDAAAVVVAGDDPEPRAYDALDLDVVVDCTSGTYVRALARDLGRALGVGGHLTALRRTRVGRFGIAEAWPLPGRNADVAPDDVPLLALAAAAARTLPVRTVDAAEARELGFGRPIAATGDPHTTAAIDRSGGLHALIEDAVGRDGAVRARVVVGGLGPAPAPAGA